MVSQTLFWICAIVSCPQFRNNSSHKPVSIPILSMYYNQARLAEVYPADKYPFLTEKFAFVQKYLKDKYQIDLEAIANGPEDWDLPLPPIPETPDEE